MEVESMRRSATGKLMRCGVWLLALTVLVPTPETRGFQVEMRNARIVKNPENSVSRSLRWLERESTVEILEQSPARLRTRYAATAVVDNDRPPPCFDFGLFNINFCGGYCDEECEDHPALNPLTADYSVSFDVVGPPGARWTLDLINQRTGMLVAVDDTSDLDPPSLEAATSVEIGSLSGTYSGPGTFTGSLSDFDSAAWTNWPRTEFYPIRKTTYANVSNGVATGAAQPLTFRFRFNARAETSLGRQAKAVCGDIEYNLCLLATGPLGFLFGLCDNCEWQERLAPGNEAAVRLGLPHSRTDIEAGRYPCSAGIGETCRDAAEEGVFFDVRLSQYCATALDCEDGDPCTVDSCPSGKCQQTVRDCDDHNVCTIDACVAGTGCASSPVTGLTCDDRNPCTLADTCQAGVCAGGSPTTDGTACDDGDFCTIDGTCQAGACVAGGSLAAPICQSGTDRWNARGPASPVQMVELDAHTPTTLYAIASGDLYKSADAASRWIRKLDGVQQIAQDTVAQGTLYGIRGSEIWKSTDAGEQWLPAWTAPGVLSGVSIDPWNHDLLYARVANQPTLYVSTDGGLTWTARALSFVPKALGFGSAPGTMLSVAVDANACPRIRRSLDGGVSWSPITNDPNQLNIWCGLSPEPTDLELFVASDPLHGSPIYLGWKVLLSNSDAFFTVYVTFRSTDNGTTWEVSHGGAPVSIHPSAPLTAFSNQADSSARFLHLIRSTDGGVTWSQLSSTSYPADCANTAWRPTGTVAAHPTMPGTLYVATQKGILKTTDDGETWTPSSDGLPGLSVRGLAADASMENGVYAGGDELLRQTNASPFWVELDLGLGPVSSVAVDPNVPNNVYAGGGVLSPTPAAFVAQSSNAGCGWTQLGPGVGTVVRDVTVDAIDHQRLWAATDAVGVNRVLRGQNGVVAWTPAGPSSSEMAYALASVPDRLLVGGQPAAVSSTTDAGTSWATVALAAGSMRVAALTADPTNALNVFAGTTGDPGGAGVFRSTDGGVTWMASNAGLTNLSVLALAVDPAAPEVVYAGTRSGVFRSADAGITWTALNAGLPSTEINRLVFQPGSGDFLYAGTEGYGVYRLRPCHADADCEDNDPCNTDSCDPSAPDADAGGCVHSTSSNPCDDGDACTIGDLCTAGGCIAGTPRNCDDHNPCTADSCDATLGCVNEPITGACEDGNVCTVGDECSGGTCVPGAALSCDDGNVCTDDSCDAGFGCLNISNSAPCDDGNTCTSADVCRDGTCVGGDEVACDDGNLCTADGCNPALGCLYVPNTAPCDDGNGCTTSDTCLAGVCGGTAKADGSACDDANSCTQIDTCQGGTCVSGMAQANGVPCDDDNACTQTDTCQAGTCVGTTPAPDGAPCDDQNQCTQSDACTSGVCAGAPRVCPPADACHTQAACDPRDGSCFAVARPDTDGDGVCDELDPCPLLSETVQADGDGDGHGDACDNCPAVANPDQRDSDRNPDDGGDLCDPCPFDAANACDTTLSGSATIGVEGGSISPPDGLVSLDVPPGAVEEPTSLSITTKVGNYQFGVPGTVMRVDFGPDGQLFDPPATIRFQWTDELLASGGISESEITLWRNGLKIAGPCGDAAYQVPACLTACSGRRCCCDMTANTLVVDVPSFSQYTVGNPEAILIPGGGSLKTDCVLEWDVVDPRETPAIKAGRLNPQRTCVDGDKLCDVDGAANGVCVFSVRACLNVTDRRLKDKSGVALCSPTDVASVLIKAPRSDDKKPERAAVGQTLQAIFANLAASTAAANGSISYANPLVSPDACTGNNIVAVPLKDARKAIMKLKVQAVTSPLPGKHKGRKDTDTLTLSCLAGG